jgi:hypothetical protein
VQKPENESLRTELRVSREEALRVASLLRYAVSLNTTVGLVSPTERRLASSTYKAIELAALVLEGKPFDEALEESNRRWTGSLEEDHRRALEVLESTRDDLQRAMSGLMPPEQLSDYLEVQRDQLLELLRSGLANPPRPGEK